MTVRVVDEKTGKPMAGVPVMYGLEVERHCRRFYPAELETSWIRGAITVTDDRGEGRIDIGEVALGFNECALDELLIVNVHVDREAKGARDAAAALSSACPGGEATCRARLEFEIANLVFHDACGEGVLSPHRRGYEGRRVLLAPPGRHQSSQIDNRCAGWLGTRLHETNRKEGEIVVVRLPSVSLAPQR